MKLVRFLPFAFFSGIHGFALFAPYAAVVLAVDLTIKKLRPSQVANTELNANREIDADAMESSPV